MCCREIVERVYAELVSRGEPESHAREAGVVIFTFHHPEVPAAEAVATVESWTRPPLLH